jgi:addiction module HigA family antidote
MIDIEHPGVMLKEDFLDDLEVKSGTLAKSIGVDRTAIKNIIDGTRGISAEMSIRLGLFFGMSDTFWLNLQRDYDLRLARRKRLVEFKANVTPLTELS